MKTPPSRREQVQADAAEEGARQVVAAAAASWRSAPGRSTGRSRCRGRCRPRTSSGRQPSPGSAGTKPAGADGERRGRRATPSSQPAATSLSLMPRPDTCQARSHTCWMAPTTPTAAHTKPTKPDDRRRRLVAARRPRSPSRSVVGGVAGEAEVADDAGRRGRRRRRTTKPEHGDGRRAASGTATGTASGSPRRRAAPPPISPTPLGGWRGRCPSPDCVGSARGTALRPSYHPSPGRADRGQ